MSIRAKLYAALAVTVVGLVVTAGVGIAGMSRLGDRFDNVQEASRAQALALQLKFDVTDFNGWQTAYGYDNGQSRPIFLSSVERYRADFAQARRRLTRPQEQTYLDQVEHAFNDFMRLDDQAYAALQAGDLETVKDIFLGPELVNFSRAAAAVRQQAREDRERSGDEEEDEDDSHRGE